MCRAVKFIHPLISDLRIASFSTRKGCNCDASQLETLRDIGLKLLRITKNQQQLLTNRVKQLQLISLLDPIKFEETADGECA